MFLKCYILNKIPTKEATMAMVASGFLKIVDKN